MSSRKSRIQLVKTTILGGVIFLVPLIVFVVVLAKAYDLMMAVAQPMAKWIPLEEIGGVALANVIAVLAVVLVCFVAGVVAQAAILRATVEGLETKVLSKVPGYVIIKGMLSGLQGDDAHKLIPAVAQIGDAARVCLEIERLDDGRVVVMTPTPPNPWSGKVYILKPDQVQRLDVPITDYMENVERFGQGTNQLLSRGTGRQT